MKLVEREFTIDASPEVVYRHLTEVKGLLRWMAVDAISDAKPGGEIRWAYENGAVMLGRYLELIPPRRIVMSYGWEDGGLMGIHPEKTTVEIELIAEGDKTRLHLIHRDLPDEHAEFHRMGWGFFLGRLVDLWQCPETAPHST
jgi:uncharacterized protein YndB with AHSA1/START domain